MTTATREKPRVAVYGRVSTVGHGQDVELQMSELRQVAEQRGWQIVEEITDEGISGAKTERPGLDRMLADARSGKLDIVAVWKLDRLGRSLAHLLQILDELAAIGVDFVSIRDSGIDSTNPQGRLLLQLLGAFSEFEREMIKERVVAGVRRAQAAGKHCGRPVVEMDLRPAVAMLDQGHGLKAITNALGVSRSTLRRRLVEAGHWPRPRETAAA